MPKGVKLCAKCGKENGPAATVCKHCQNAFPKPSGVKAKAFINKAVEKAIAERSNEGTEALSRVANLEKNFDSLRRGVLAFLETLQPVKVD